MNLDTADAADLADLPEFLVGWLTSDPARLAALLRAYTGHPPTPWNTSATA